MTDTVTKPVWNATLRGLLAMLPENINRKMLLAHYADRMGIPRDDFKRRFPGYDTAMITHDDFEDALAYFCQDLLVDRVGIDHMTQAGFDDTVAEVLRALVDDAMRQETAGQA